MNFCKACVKIGAVSFPFKWFEARDDYGEYIKTDFKKAQLYICLFCSPTHVWFLTFLEVPYPPKQCDRECIKVVSRAFVIPDVFWKKFL